MELEEFNKKEKDKEKANLSFDEKRQQYEPKNEERKSNDIKANTHKQFKEDGQPLLRTFKNSDITYKG